MTLPETTFPETHTETHNDLDHLAADAWFGRYFGASLPRGLRQRAAGMSWPDFVAAFGPTAGPLRLGQWACTDVARRATRLGPQARNYRAVIALGDHISASTAAAGGPVAALTAMLHERRIALEILNFHQMQSGDQTVTLLRGTDGVRAQWAMGWSQDPTQSALRAVIASANRLMS